MREFLQAELQIFFDPATWDVQLPFEAVAARLVQVAFAEEKGKGGFATHTAKDLVARGLPRFYAYHLVHVQDFYLRTLAVPPDRFRFAELSEKERAFYNKTHFDVEVKQDSLGGFKEVGGIHYRTDHDLRGHQAASKERLEVSVDGRKVLPHVLELSFGIDRNLWALLDLKYDAGERSALRLPSRLAPISTAVFPLVSKDGLPERAREVWEALRRGRAVAYDEAGSIGRRYARMDEIGTPFCVTIDHQTLQDGTLTIRERDSTQQKRISQETVPGIVASLLSGARTFGAL